MIVDGRQENFRILEVLIGIMLLLSAGVVFLHLLMPIVIINSIVISLYLLCFFNYIKNKDFRFNRTHPNSQGVVSWYLLLIIHLGLLFFIRGEDDRFIYAFFWHVVILTCFFLDVSIIKGGIRVFSNIVFWIVLLAVINYVITFIGIDLPSHQFNISTRGTTYLLYPGTVRLFSQTYNVFGFTGFRLSGIFPEPSMFGIVCALVLYSGVFNQRKFRQIVIFVGLLLSLSTGAIILSFGLYLFSKRKGTSKFITILSVMFVTAVLLLIIPREIIDTFFVDKLSGKVIEGRVVGDFNAYYKQFLDAGSFKSQLIGKGAEVLENAGFVASDYRGFLLKYGFAGAIFMFLFIWSLTSFKGDFSDKLTVFYIFVVLFAHRSWFVVTFIFLFYIYFLSIKNYKNYDYA